MHGSRFLVASISTVLALAVGLLALRLLRDGDGDSVQLVDTSAELDALLAGGSGVGGRVTEDVARLLFPALAEDPKRVEFHPLILMRRRGPGEIFQPFLEHPDQGWTHRVNAAHFRGPDEPATERPPLRVIVAGDSHVEGAVPFEETASEVLEGLLAERTGDVVEVLNGAVGGHTLINYAGLLEATRGLEPHVFVAVVYGGNDLGLLVRVMHHLKGLGSVQSPQGYGWMRSEAAGNSTKAFAQITNQVGFFAHHPQERAVAIDGAVELTLAMQRSCDERGVALVMVYLPSILDSQPEEAGPDLENHLKLFRVSAEDRDVTDEVADAWIERVRAQGVRLVDLRPAWRAAEEALFWKTDYHINTAGHRLLAEAIAPAVLEEKQR